MLVDFNFLTDSQNKGNVLKINVECWSNSSYTSVFLAIWGLWNFFKKNYKKRFDKIWIKIWLKVKL